VQAPRYPAREKVHCQTAGCPQQGIVYDTEINAARNILERATDPQINRYTPTHEVKRILIERPGRWRNCPTTTQATTTAAAVSEKLISQANNNAKGLGSSTVQLTFDPDVEAFRAEFVAFLDEHVPAAAAEALERPEVGVAHCRPGPVAGNGSCSTTGWLLPTQPPEFGGRNATVLQQYVYLEELCRRRIYTALIRKV